jgi:hypothetical protein
MNENVSEPVRVTALVARALERLGIRYLVGGSLASSVHGVPRATNDSDLLAEIWGKHAEPLAAALGSAFYADASAILDATMRGEPFNVIHLETMFKVDVFVVGRDEGLRQEMDRRQSHSIDGVELYVASPEDVVVQKLVWFRKGGELSERQWRDVRGVLEVQGERFDSRYARRCAESTGVSDLLERALAESGAAFS